MGHKCHTDSFILGPGNHTRRQIHTVQPVEWQEGLAIEVDGKK